MALELLQTNHCSARPFRNMPRTRQRTIGSFLIVLLIKLSSFLGAQHNHNCTSLGLDQLRYYSNPCVFRNKSFNPTIQHQGTYRSRICVRLVPFYFCVIGIACPKPRRLFCYIIHLIIQIQFQSLVTSHRAKRIISMAETARQTTVEKVKGLTMIEMEERSPSPSGSTRSTKPIKPIQRAKTVNLSTDDYFVCSF
jgi:hypothetical protein